MSGPAKTIVYGEEALSVLDGLPKPLVTTG